MAPHPKSAAAHEHSSKKQKSTRMMKEKLHCIDLYNDMDVICNGHPYNMKHWIPLLCLVLGVTHAYRHNGTCARCLWNYVYECAVHGNKNWTLMETQYPGGPPPSSPSVDGTYGFPGEVLYGRARAYPGDDGNPKFFLSYDIVDYCGSPMGQASVEVRLVSTGLLQTIESYATVPRDIPGPSTSSTGLRNGSGYPNLWRYVKHPGWWPGERVFGPLPEAGEPLYSKNLLPASVLIHKVGDGLLLPAGSSGLYINMTHDDVRGARTSSAEPADKSDRPWHHLNGGGYAYYIGTSEPNGETGPVDNQAAYIAPNNYPALFDSNGNLDYPLVWAEIAIRDNYAASGLAFFDYRSEDSEYGSPAPNRNDYHTLNQRIIGRNGTVNFLVGFGCLFRVAVRPTYVADVYPLYQPPSANNRLEAQSTLSRGGFNLPVHHYAAEQFLSVYNSLGSSMIVPKLGDGFATRQQRGQFPYLIDDITSYFRDLAGRTEFRGTPGVWSPAQFQWCTASLSGWKLPGAFAQETDRISAYANSRFGVDDNFAFANNLFCNVNFAAPKDAVTVAALTQVTADDNTDYFNNSAFFNYTVPSYTDGVPGQCCDGHRDQAPQGNKIYCGYYSNVACSCGEGWGGLLCNDPIPDWRTFDPATATECPSWDICLGRGTCVKKNEYDTTAPANASGVGCVCRPGWVGGGAYNDPDTVIDHVYSGGVKPWVDLYVQQLTSFCDGERARYEFDEEHSDWAVKYPELHQCMIWSPTNDSDFIDYTAEADCQAFDGKFNCSRWTTASGGTMPGFPYDCANRSTQGRVGVTGTFNDGPVWGGFWCNLCPACVWNNTERCDDAFPGEAHLAPNRDNVLASVKCYCRSEFTGVLCQFPTCPGDDSDPSDASLDRSACGADSGRGTCRANVQQPVYCGRASPLPYPSFPELCADGAPVFNFTQNDTGTVFAGRCDCNEGWGGSVVGACSVELCAHDSNGLACGHHGSCVLSDCPNYTETERIALMRTFAGFVSYSSMNDCNEAVLRHGYDTLPTAENYVLEAPVCRALEDCSTDYCGFFGTTLAVWPPVTGQLLLNPTVIAITGATNATPACVEIETGEFVPFQWYSEWTPPTSLCDSGTCVCDPGWEHDERGVCSLRSCSTDANGLQCHNVTRTGTTDNVCRADPVSPQCECWRALASPREDKFNVDDGKHFYGPVCNLSYADQCVDPFTGVTCNGPAVSDGCYVDGCKDDWSDCELTANRSLLVPRCHCKASVGAYGQFCNASVCGGFSSEKPCTANNEGSIITGQCNIVTKTCDCFDSAHINDANPGSPAGVKYIGDNCEIPVAECGGPDNYGDHPCSGRGNCTVGVGCSCPPAYNGSRCQTELPCGGCDPDGGVCFDGQCYCHRNYIGTLCNINACEQTGGNSSSADTCVCPEGSTQYPNVHDVGYQAVLPAGQAYDTLERVLLLNPVELESTFRGCRKLCSPSPAMESAVECGGYYPSLADAGNCPKDTYTLTADSEVRLLTRCKQRVSATSSETPNCTCADEAPNPNVLECNSLLETSEYHAWKELSLDSGALTCRPQCLFCFERSSGECELSKCVGTEGWSNYKKCQYTGNLCDTKPCAGHSHHQWDPVLQRCVCLPEWLYDDSGICTENHTKCVETGGSLPPAWDASDVSDACNCTHPYRTDLDKSSPTFGACESVCGADGTPEGSGCTCLAGGVISGTFCNESQCQHLGTPDIARRDDGTSAYSDRCKCPLPQWQGTYCNTSACAHGVPKADTEQGCDCYLGFRGVLCDVADCGPRGTAVRVGDNGTCQCSPGWAGTSCDRNLCRIDLGVNNSHKAPDPEPCSDDPESPLPTCLMPGFDYNCKCGDGYHATFVNVSGVACCDNVTHLDCGPHGQWGTYSHNNTYGCQCQFGYTGHHCENHVCGDDGYDQRHRLVRTLNESDGSYYVECACHEPNFVEINGTCVANCSYGTVVHSETDVYVINDPQIPFKCICSDPDYVVDVWPATWLDSNYENTSGLHCRKNCSASGTAYIDANETCVCLDAFTGPRCFVRAEYVLATNFEFDQAPVWHWGVLGGVILVVAGVVVLYQYGYMPITCYASVQEQQQRRLALGRQDMVSGQENTGLMSKRR